MFFCQEIFAFRKIKKVYSAVMFVYVGGTKLNYM